MKICVCIPVYNGAQYIGTTIESVLNQSYKEFELLIVDNHSTDQTVEVVKQFQDPRIRLVQNDRNYGMFENWNICLRTARGKYIQMLCADDFLETDCLKKKVSILEKNPDAVLVFSASNVVDAQGKILMRRRPFHGDFICDGKRMAKRSFRSGNVYGEPSNVLFCRKTSRQTGEFNHRLFYTSDWDYWLRLSMEGKVAYMDEYLTNFRVSGSSATSNIIGQIRKLKKDDVLFVRRVCGEPAQSITKIDILIHYITVNARLFAKLIFCMIANNRQGKLLDRKRQNTCM